ncbi:coiled-coil and C2 domain-containing protein 2A [Achlya hypogyna]|uniref:Coiled-coil and C2 domain-containing protein 2A n=1 Tax=Achlya hypogyna TaxID=1202772 RepID=A0A1V9Z407_ACHHY|nr:coiled-coil and C2 domain-containing protein 2A [Achlya hypogyna]
MLEDGKGDGPEAKPKLSRFQSKPPEDNDNDNDYGIEEDNQRVVVPDLAPLTQHGRRVRMATDANPSTNKILVHPTPLDRISCSRPASSTYDMDDGIYRPETLDKRFPAYGTGRLVDRATREQALPVHPVPNPLATSAVRPSLSRAPTSTLRTQWIDPSRSAPIYSELVVRLPKLHLSDHALFALEDSVSLQLRFLYHDYTATYAGVATLEHRLARLQALAPTAAVPDVRAEVTGLAQVLTALRDAFAAVYAKWGELKALRQAQQAAHTPVVLSLRPVDSSAVVSCVTAAMAETRRCGNDAEVVAALVELEAVLDAPQCLAYVVNLANDPALVDRPTDAEVARRKAVRGVRVHCELSVNGNVVMETKPAPLTWPNFTVDFNDTVVLRVTAKPSAMTLRVFERTPSAVGAVTFYRTTCLTSRPVPLLLPGHAFATAICAAGAAPTDEWYQFSHATPIPREAWGVGFRDSPLHATTVRHTKGAVHVHLSWRTSSDEHKIPVQTRAKLSSGRWVGHRPQWTRGDDATHFAHERDFHATLAALPTLDPNAPGDQPAVRLQTYHGAQAAPVAVFRTPEVTALRLSAASGPSLLKRHALLKLRDQDPGRHGVLAAPIPLSEHAIAQTPAYLELVRPEVPAFERHLAEEAMRAEAKDGLAYTRRRLELRRHDVCARLHRNHVSTDGRGGARYQHLSTIVQEYPRPLLFKGWTPDLSGWAGLFARKRRLRPAKKAPPPQSRLLVDHPDECRVYVQVQRLASALVRRAGEAPPPRRPRNDSGSDVDVDDTTDEPATTQLLVEVTFQGHTRATATATGLHPAWMETVALPFAPPLDDWSPAALARVRDPLTLTLVDHVVIEDTATRRKEPHRRCIGRVRVPFGTLLQNGEVAAPLQVELPHVHLGYARRGTRAKLPTDADESSRRDDSATYLTVMVKLDPPLAAPAAESSLVAVPNEPPALMQHAEKWTAATSGLTLQHIFMPAVSGEPTFVTRFLRPQAPPTSLVGRSPRSLARFVSLIPFLEEWHGSAGAPDVWASTQDFLDMQVGGWQEHAVLLCNYFNHADAKGEAKSYLLLGTVVPDGDGVFVLRQTPRQTTLWNARSGVATDVTDLKCPLRCVRLVASADNIWGNLQPAAAPRELPWAAIETNPRVWKPFFSAATTKDSLQAVLPSVQLANPTYHPTPTALAQDVQVELLESIKVAVRKWRSSHSTTVFNSDVSSHLKEVLQGIEMKRTSPDSVDDNHVSELFAKYPRFEFHGGPFSFPFLDVADIVDEIQATQIHSTIVSGAEFALAVHVHPYPNFVLAVWVYFAAMTPKDL